ncbi:SDR family oxidoreductase [Xanthobacter dioxanivorans]|uniref:SDR family oxidoreductase n=1 Tax=Xanthobacter dioxanivorans TaxID=2528964 RepID=A0A974PP06_9HYPH|nr:SDR family oxidoreductase [Xanthobacter dioxanivorans]QRG07080.1 SDR family oxidoreductase [Xanthobacter dioxanivorans]
MSLGRDLDFTGRRVLVTGAANGFGAAMAELYAEHGARLVLADLEEAPLRAIAGRLGVEAMVFDQGDLASVTALAEQAGEVDVLVNNAGILVARPLLETPMADAARLVNVDFLGVMALMQAIGRGMVERRRGVILSISSQTAFCGGENRGVYAAAKAAVSQLTRAVAVEWGPYGVRVVCLAPGRALTRMTAETARADYSGDRGLARVPLGRWGTAEEVAKMALFLTSDAAGYVTGETVIADGGYVLG